MRRFTLLLLVGLLTGGTAAEAARRDSSSGPQGTHAARPGQAAAVTAPARSRPAQATSVRPRGAAASAQQVGRRQQARQASPGRLAQRSARAGAADRQEQRISTRGAVASQDRRTASAHYACPRGGRAQGRRCSTGRGATRWHVGLPPAANSQRECPEGTFATLARGHTDVVRCLPLL